MRQIDGLCVSEPAVTKPTTPYVGLRHHKDLASSGFMGLNAPIRHPYLRAISFWRMTGPSARWLV
jgi:hypothetical protein